MATLEDYRNGAFVSDCNKALADFMEETHGVKTVLIATPDGFEIASHSTGAAHSVENLAAVGSSLFALGASLASQFELGASRSITIDNDKGKVYISAITGENNRSLVLLLEASQQVMLAHILHGSKKLTTRIANQLNAIA